MIDSFPKPDFVVVGMTWRDGVALLASRTLNSAQLEEEMERVMTFHKREPIRDHVTITLTADLDDYIEVWGDSYPAAWAELFAQWSPTSRAKPLPSKRLEIT